MGLSVQWMARALGATEPRISPAHFSLKTPFAGRMPNAEDATTPTSAAQSMVQVSVTVAYVMRDAA